MFRLSAYKMRNRLSFVYVAIITFLVKGITISQSMWTNFEMGAYHDMNGTESPMQFNLKTTRISRTSYGISGTFIIRDDLKNYEVESKLYFDANGNGDYVLHPLRKLRTPVCDVANEEYRKYVMEAYSKTSDLPNSDDKDLCPLFEKKTYTLKNSMFDTKNIPQFLQSGWYKAHTLVYDKNGALVSGLEANARLY